MIKKVYVDFAQAPFKKDITIIVVLHRKCIDIELVYLCIGNLEKSMYKPFIKMSEKMP